jgi:inner membrane protein
MDVVTHGLASYALTRAAFPGISRATMMGAMVAGTIADVDLLSAQFGPGAYLQWHSTYLHSFAGALLIAVVVSAVLIFALRRRQAKDAARGVFFAALTAALLHVVMDFWQNDRVRLFWPFRAQRYSADLVARFDLWILLMLLAGVLLPLLLGLVTEEIGAKSKAPRGRMGAMLALAAVCIYVGTRSILHGNAVAMMDAQVYRGESPRRVAALAEPDSPLHWRGIVETERTLHELEVNVGPGASFDPNSGFVTYKPEISLPLETAQKTDAAREFLQSARFPKASVEKSLTGYRVELRDFAYHGDVRPGLRAMVVVETDDNAEVTTQQLAWEPSGK